MTNEEYIARDLGLSGVSKWHSAGFKGKGISVLNLEEEGGFHSEQSYKCIHNVVPEATIYRAEFRFNSDATTIIQDQIVDDGVVYDLEEYIASRKIKIISFSMQGTQAPSEPVRKYWKSVQDRYNVIIFNSTGNDGEYIDGTPFSFETSIQVGAMMVRSGNLERAYYSNGGEQTDFMALTFGYTGTSFSAPFLAGMAALICSRLGDLTFAEMYNYLKHYSLDFGKVGDDFDFGWGMPVMPDVNKKYITLTVGSTVMMVDGVGQTLDTVPIIDKNNRTLVPIRRPMEALGHKVEWIGEEKKVVIYE